MTLRLGVLVFGGLLLVLALVLGTHPALWGVALYCAVYGLLIVGGIVLERSRYAPPVDRAHGPWQETGERFRDPTTGQMTEVRYNPVTGERDYASVEESGNNTGREY